MLMASRVDEPTPERAGERVGLFDLVFGGFVDRYRDHLHPDDLASASITTSEVTLRNDVGSITLPVVADSGVARGTIAVEFNQPNVSIAQLLDAARIVTSVQMESAS